MCGRAEVGRNHRSPFLPRPHSIPDRSRACAAQRNVSSGADMSAYPNNAEANAIAELQTIRQTLQTIEPGNQTMSLIGHSELRNTEKSTLVARHNQILDILWKRHTAHRLDPAKYFPIEIAILIFSFVVYHVVEPEDPWTDFTLTPRLSRVPEMHHLFLSVSKAWCYIVTNHHPFWSTILINQMEDEYLERIHLFLDRFGKKLLDISSLIL